MCKKYWYATDERLKNWPSISPKGLYHVLEEWTQREGFYVLAQNFPFGLLVFVRIVDGCVIANAIRFVPNQDGKLEEVHVPILQIDFEEEPSGTVRSIAQTPLLGDVPVTISSSDADMQALSIYSRFFAGRSVLDLFPARRILKISQATTVLDTTARAGYRDVAAEGKVSAADEDPDPDNAQENDDDQDMHEPDEDSGEDPSDIDDDEPDNGVREFDDEVSRLAQTPDEATRQTHVLLKRMFRRKHGHLILVRSPDDFVSQEEDFLGVRPGLYVGDYGHQMYGQFRTEVLLLEYKLLTQEELRKEQETPTTVFARPGLEDPPDLECLLDVDDDVTFMCGIKQCGDFHVCMGATTFVTVCGPAEACTRLAEGKTPPQIVLNRQRGVQEHVVRAWRGWGTLAMPGFLNPSWAGGWLVQVQGNSPQEGHRFGFCWDRNQDAVILQWIDAQDSSPFLQREWLPEALQ
jgi:hypothetical protein